MKKILILTALFVSIVFSAMAMNSSLPAPDTAVQTPELSTIPQKENITTNDNTPSDKIERRGCCSHHGGVCGCDQASGKIKCCDGTLSPSCTCADY